MAIFSIFRKVLNSVLYATPVNAYHYCSEGIGGCYELIRARYVLTRFDGCVDRL